MRGSHRVNFRRVLSLPTRRRDTCLLGRYRPQSSVKCSVSTSGKDSTRSPAVRSSFSLSQEGKDAKSSLPCQRTESGTKTDDDSNSSMHVTQASDLTTQNAGKGSCSFGRRSLWDPLPDWPLNARINGTFDRECILSSALSSLVRGKSSMPVEMLLERDIGRNVFNLPVPRLSMWLYNLDVNKLLSLTLRHIYSDHCSSDKVLVAESVIWNKIGLGGSPSSFQQALHLLRLQRALVFSGIKSDINLSLYRVCIDFLNLRLGSMSSDSLVPLCVILGDLWEHLLTEGKLDTIRDSHHIVKDGIDMFDLYSPLLPFLEKSLFGLCGHTVVSLLKLLTRMQCYVPRESLRNLQELSFLKVIELSGTLPLSSLVRALVYLEKVDSVLPPPLYFVCRDILGKASDTVSYRTYHLVTRCLSRCSSVDLLSLKRILLLYLSFSRTCGVSLCTSVDRFVMIVILRAFEVTGASIEGRRDLTDFPSTPVRMTVDVHEAHSEAVPLPRGYYHKVSSMGDMRWLLLESLKSLGQSYDTTARRLCDISYLKRHYSVPGSVRLPLLTLLEASCHAALPSLSSGAQ